MPIGRLRVGRGPPDVATDGLMTSEGLAHRAAEECARHSYGRLVAYLAASTGDLAAAEDAIADALLAALESWPRTGIPSNPDAWLLTVARRRHVDRRRRRATADRSLSALALLDEERAQSSDATGDVPDRRLELLYVCAHPAINRAMHAPLMLQSVLGLDAARIASAFVISPTTMGQRLARAKGKIRDSAIAFVLPSHCDLPGRTASVLDAIYAAYGSGWDDPTGADARRRGLTDEATRLARLVVELAPDDPEARGLLALLLHCEARSAARRDEHGAFVPLDRQDVTRWSRDEMGEAESHLARAVSAGTPGAYQLMAAIQSLHNRRALTGSTDWVAIAFLYDGLVALAPSVGARVARAATRARVDGPRRALALLDELDQTRVAEYQPYWATRAHLLTELGDDQAPFAVRRALGLTTDPSVRAHLMSTYGLDPGRSP